MVYTSFIASTPSISLLFIPIGDFIAVTLAGQGEINMTPILFEGSPVSSIAFFLAKDSSKFYRRHIGEEDVLIRLGNLICIRRTTVGQAVLIIGHLSLLLATYFWLIPI